jgi:serine/alanine adding enzyme
MTIRLYTESDRDNWDQYVMKSNSSSCYHLIGWKNVIEKTFGHKTYYLLSEDENLQINGILPMVHLKSLLFGNFAVSLPYFNYGGVCADTEEIGNELLRAATDITKSQGMQHLELRHVHNTMKDLPVKTTKVSMRLSLPSTSEELMKSFPAKLRSQIKRPLQENMYARVAGEEELDSFYAVFSQNMRDLGTPVYAKSFFRNILETFPDNTWICTVYTEKVQPAAGFLTSFKDTIEIPWASSLKAFNRLSPNMLLYWSVLEFACNNGFKVFDFGRSTPNEGTYKFKQQWGAQPVQLHWHYWLRNGGSLPEINPHNPKYGLAIRTWQKLPVSLTRLIGPSLVKNLP